MYTIKRAKLMKTWTWPHNSLHSPPMRPPLLRCSSRHSHHAPPPSSFNPKGNTELGEMESRKFTVKPQGGGNSDTDEYYRFEHKIFLVEIENGGSMAVIKERNWTRAFSLKIDFSWVSWLIEEPRREALNFKEEKLFRKYQASYALFWLQRYRNKNGSFISLSKVKLGTVCSIIIFPVGRDGEVWFGVSKAMENMLFAQKLNKSEKSKQQVSNRITQLNKGQHREKERIMTYTEIVSSKKHTMRG